ncbi:DUF3530 family protein [Marinimicrobium sp. ABcell2]|uniref:DUF3530 family protein n=1 Tax=Marinimicrobium sp. ABcell2 TaxID=3069751 RepID=UPI0027B61864|nr:DUF3530 family protein [Marinimicrobium sp. ABcell2]MDQ2077606.1 DUF3530 family protein [Marinimicrobium sp. ABcell2]
MRYFLPAPSKLCAICLAALLAWPSHAEDEQEEAEATIEEPARFASRAERDRALLASAFPREAHRLNTPEGEVLMLLKPALHAEPKGTLVMVHSADRAGDWPPAWENLRRALPYYGWATLALAVPTPPGPVIPPRPVETREEVETAAEADAAPPEEAPAEEEPLTREQRIAARLDGVLALLEADAAQNLVLLVDNVNASAVFAHVKPELQVGEPGEQPGHSPLAGPIRALVLANLYPSQPLSQGQLEELFSVPELPVLDVFPENETPANRRQRQLHRGLAQRQNMAHYQALALPYPRTPDLDDSSSYSVLRLHSFMTHQNNAETRRRID